MKQYGTVVETNDNIAKVEVDRKSACDMCENAAHCVEKCKKVYATALNELDANIGDLVEIQTDTKRVLFNSFFVFMLPIFLAVFAYFAIDVFFSESIAVVATFIVLISSVCLFSKLLNNREKKHIVSKIVRIL